ncbi:unnamed protein product [Ectocarpus sp. CCAP 1310/34]|nr:unnamed protein product [Ectocarpus sp. CCAP 1310/34]
MRKNGFEAPLEPLQVLTWVLLLLIVGGFYSFIVPALEQVWAMVAGLVYGVLASSTVLAGVLACLRDPIDPNVRRFHQGETAAGSAADKTFCFLCQLHVNKGSRHCRYCDKCVDRFDHHCKWLNNCVGRSNYRYFVTLLVSTFFMTSIQLGISSWFAVMYHSDNVAFSDRVEGRYARLGGTGHIVLVYAFAVLVLPFLGLLAQLLGFHIMLISRNLTTYDYIVQEQRKERERKERRRILDKEKSGARRPLACCVSGERGGVDAAAPTKSGQALVP